MTINNSILHYTILKHIIEKGFAPDIETLSKLLNTDEKAIADGLYALQEYHGVVLHPNEPKIWVIHPFALAPTNFFVKSQRGEWWGNCAWCSLGIAALLNENVIIRTTVGAHGEPVQIDIIDGEILQKDLFIHFPIPMQKAWDNVIYTCSTMLVFRSEQEIESWCRSHNISKGDIQPIDNIWQFSKKWYGNHLNQKWEKWTMQEAKQLFHEFGLHNDIWQLQSSGERF